MSTLKILIVDDEPGIRSGVYRIQRNFRVDINRIFDDFVELKQKKPEI